MGRSRTDRARSRAAWLPAVPLLLGLVGLAGCGDRPPAETHVVAARDADVVRADGSTTPASAGQVLHAGEALRTAADGAAILDTRGRQAYLGGDSLYYLPTVDRVELRRGALIVDGRHGPSLKLALDTVQVSAPSGAIVRLERTATVRVGVFAGSATLKADGDGTLQVPRYYQALMVGQRLPTRPTALVLTAGDPVERRVAPDLVADNEALQRTAAALDAGSEGRTIITVATRSGWVAQSSYAPAAGTTPGAAAPATSELALPVAIARAAFGTDNRAVAAAVRQARALRGENGSWGVVARIVGTNSAAVSGVIDALLGPGFGTGPIPGSGPGDQGGPIITLPGGGSPTPTPTPGRSGGPKPSPSGHPHPTSTPTPTATPGPVDEVKDIVGKLVPTPSLGPLGIPLP